MVCLHLEVSESMHLTWLSQTKVYHFLDVLEKNILEEVRQQI